MLNEFLPVAVSLIGLVANAVLQVAAFRFVTKGSVGRSLLIGFMAGFLTLSFFEYYLYPYKNSAYEFWSIAIANTIIYVCVSYCYFGIIGLALSLRIRILDIVDRGVTGIPYERIAEQFDSKGLFEKRITRLLDNGQVKKLNGRYYSVESAFLIIARLNTLVKKLLVGKASEFDE